MGKKAIKRPDDAPKVIFQMEDIIKAAEEVTGVEQNKLMGYIGPKGGTRDETWPKEVISWFAKWHTPLSWEEISNNIDGVHHSTTIHRVANWEDARTTYGKEKKTHSRMYYRLLEGLGELYIVSTPIPGGAIHSRFDKMSDVTKYLSELGDPETATIGLMSREDYKIFKSGLKGGLRNPNEVLPTKEIPSECLWTS